MENYFNTHLKYSTSNNNIYIHKKKSEHYSREKNQNFIIKKRSPPVKFTSHILPDFHTRASIFHHNLHASHINTIPIYPLKPSATNNAEQKRNPEKPQPGKFANFSIQTASPGRSSQFDVQRRSAH